MKVALIGPSESYYRYSSRRILEECKKEFETEVIPLLKTRIRLGSTVDVMYGKKSLSSFDYILPRIDSKRAEMAYPVFRVLDLFQTKKPYPAETILIAHNKFLTLERLVANDIPVPETYFTGSKDTAKEIISKHNLPIIIKLLSGFGGQGVMIMESREAAASLVETMGDLKQEILIEEFINNPGEDIRGFVAGGEVIASYKRVAAKGERKANIKQGGRGENFKLTDEMTEIVLKASESIGAKICAIDFIEGKDGVKVIEANINPGLEGIEKVTGINVAQRIVEFVKSELRR